MASYYHEKYFLKKPNDPISRKLSDGQTDESDFIGGCPIDGKRPISSKL